MDDSLRSSIVRPRSKWLSRFGSEVNTGDRVFRAVTALLALTVLATLLLMAFEMYRSSEASIDKFGWDFITSQDWDPVRDQFGALPFIYGTVVSSLLALAISVPVSIGIAIFLSELAPSWLRDPRL